MFDHVGVVFKDLKRSGDLYGRLLAPLGIRLMEDHTQADGTGWLVFSTGAPESPFFVVAAGRPSFWTPAAAPATRGLAGETPRRARPGASPRLYIRAYCTTILPVACGHTQSL